MGLFNLKPAWQSDDFYKAERAVDKTKNQKKLAFIAQTAQNETIRVRAVWKLTDQNVLAGIAEKDISINVRLSAARKLTDKSTDLAQKVFTEVVKNKNINMFERESTAEYLSDEKFKQKIIAELKIENKKRTENLEKESRGFIMESIKRGDFN